MSEKEHTPGALKMCQMVRDALKEHVYETGKPGTWATKLDDTLAEVIDEAKQDAMRIVCERHGEQDTGLCPTCVAEIVTMGIEAKVTEIIQAFGSSKVGGS